MEQSIGGMIAGYPDTNAPGGSASSTEAAARMRARTAKLRRGAITAFIARHLLLWEGAIAALSVAYLVASVLTDETHGATVPLVIVLSAVFLTEFVVRCWDSTSRGDYVRSHWVDLICCLPMVGVLRSVRIIRVLRLAPVARAVVASRCVVQGRRGQSRLLIGLALAALWLGFAVAYWTLEHGANPNLRFVDALYWSFITATTLGQGDGTPHTPEGHLLQGLLIFLGIGLIGCVSARITAAFIGEPDTDAPVLEEVTLLRSELREIHALLAARRQD
jgi:voltage-gated potassium channel